MAGEEKEICEECGSENTLDAVFIGKMVKMCRRCAEANGAVILKKPTTEQITRAERESSLQVRVRQWRNQRGGVPEATLETLRRRKQEIDSERQKKREDLMKKQVQETKKIIDFRSKQVTIGELKKMELKPTPIGLEQEKAAEMEIGKFKEEVRQVRDQQKLEDELEVPVPIEPLEPELEPEPQPETEEPEKEEKDPQSETQETLQAST
jgi:hypothetical protein